MKTGQSKASFFLASISLALPNIIFKTAPAGVSASDIVREESLPKRLHVIRATDGVGKLDSDPNRLTLVLSEEGRIVIAAWD